MPKTFNITAVCRPAIHYMADIGRQVSSIKKFVDNGQYFVINRPRQYGKTTILHALAHILQSSYYVVLLDFQKISQSKLENENKFCVTFAKMFLKSLERNKIEKNSNIKKAVSDFIINMEKEKENFELPELFENLLNICGIPERPFVLIIDKIDSASGSQVFLDFLAQLRAAYIDSSFQKTFHSVILAGVHDIKNLKRKIRPEEDHNINSPWNIAANFDVDLSLTEYSIRDMLKEYEKDYNTGMDINTMAELIYSYTSGYPFLVSRLCKFMDEEITQDKNLKTNAWTKEGFNKAVQTILSEKNTLFDSLSGKLEIYKKLNSIIKSLLFTGKNIAYNPDETSTNIATDFGFIKNQDGFIAVANRIFEMRLYNFYLSDEELKNHDIYKTSLQNKNQFIIDGHLDVNYPPPKGSGLVTAQS